jgi:hypothetical protein
METLWRPAKLFSTAGLKGNSEREGRATSTLLAVMQAVPELTYALLRPLGAPKGRVQTFTEVRLHDAADLLAIPGGAILVEPRRRRDQRSARALADRRADRLPVRACLRNRELPGPWRRQLDRRT